MEMSSRNCALLISNKQDVSLDYVVDELRCQKKSYLRLNTEDLPTLVGDICLPNLCHELERDDRKWNVHRDFCGILYRRPGRPFHYDDLATKDQVVLNYCWEQWASYLDSLLLIEGISWINHPVVSNTMESKIKQLHMAHNIGFRIPRTCITWSKSSSKQFIESCDSGAVVKSLCSSLLEYPNHDYFVFTNGIDNVDDVDQTEFSMAPIILQERIPDKLDVRVTVVGTDIFAVGIESTDDLEIPLDWRTKKDAIRFAPMVLPTAISELCLDYVKSCGLVFGAIDLIYSNGMFYFIEINPNGEWGWLQANANLPIAHSLVNALFNER